MRTSVYEFFDANDELLYVGVTNGLPHRLGQHDADKPWWTAVVRVEVEHYETRADALDRERTLIQSLRPLHNVQHSLGYIEWAEILEAFPQVGTILERARTLDPSPCGIENFFACTRGDLVGLPDEVRVLVQFRLSKLLPDCQEPCTCDGDGE